MWKTIQAGNSWAGEFLNQRKDGTTYYQRTIISPVLDDEGAISHFVSIASDITMEKKLEEQMIQAAKMDSLGRLASGIAHDFNNYLTIINGYSRDAARRERARQGRASACASSCRRGRTPPSWWPRSWASAAARRPRPAVLDVNATLNDLEHMVRRLLGEKIELCLDLAPRRRQRFHRSRAARAGADQPGDQRPRRHARRRPA